MSESEQPYEGPDLPYPGDAIAYVDETGRVHTALVTAYWGGNQPNGALNCVYVSSDVDKRDPYGVQLERASSVSRRQDGVTAHGRFWYPLYNQG